MRPCETCDGEGEVQQGGNGPDSVIVPCPDCWGPTDKDEDYSGDDPYAPTRGMGGASEHDMREYQKYK